MTMTCDEFRNAASRWLNREWAESEERQQIPQALREHGSTCARCRTRLEVLELLARPSELSETTPPADLALRVMNRITAEERNRKRYTRAHTGEGARTGARFGLIMRWFVLPAAAAAALFVALTLGWSHVEAAPPNVEMVHLYIAAPHAQQVSVVGDWNGWTAGEDRLQDPDGDGVWEIELKIPSGGEYQYQFLINGEKWVPDPHSLLHIDDGFGGQNSVLAI